MTSNKNQITDKTYKSLIKFQSDTLKSYVDFTTNILLGDDCEYYTYDEIEEKANEIAKQSSTEDQVKSTIKEMKKDPNISYTCKISNNKQDNVNENCSTVSELLNQPKTKDNSNDKELSKIKTMLNKSKFYKTIQDAILTHYKPSGYNALKVEQDLIEQYKKLLKFNEEGEALNLKYVLDTIEKDAKQ